MPGRAAVLSRAPSEVVLPMEEKQETSPSARLEKENEEYRRLKEQHHEFDEKLREMSTKRILTDLERVESTHPDSARLIALAVPSGQCCASTPRTHAASPDWRGCFFEPG